MAGCATGVTAVAAPCLKPGAASVATGSLVRRWLAGITAVIVSTAALASPAQDYMLHCMGCHGTEARGVPGKIPPLANMLSRFMRTPEGRNYVLRVPGAANSALSDSQLAAVLNWLAVTYDSSASARGIAPFTSEEVARLRHTPLPAVLAARSAVVRNLAATGPAPPAQY
jgi:mono/diheme cytochrome c family protein